MNPYSQAAVVEFLNAHHLTGTLRTGIGESQSQFHSNLIVIGPGNEVETIAGEVGHGSHFLLVRGIQVANAYRSYNLKPRVATTFLDKERSLRSFFER